MRLHPFPLTLIRNMHIKPIKMRWATGGVNYAYLLSTQDKTKSWIIDPAETEEVLPNLSDSELKSIYAVVNTHHHYDHSDGNLGMINALKTGGNTNVVGVIAGSTKSPGTTDIPEHNQVYKLGNLEIRCIRTPCHTRDSTCYYVSDPETNEHAIFTGDTLFTGGCGRFFEGVGEEMDKALNFTMLDGVGRENLAVTKVFPGHEYTKGNVKFIRAAVYKQPGENKAVDELEEFANKNKVTTGCFTLQDELNFNPFMRLEDPAVRKAVGDVKGEWTRAQVMDKLREMKNSM